jgi:tol-pal system protein YbgF
MTKRTTWIWVAAVMTIVAAQSGRVVAADREHQQLMADIRMLQEQNLQLQLLLGQLQESLKLVNAKLEDQTATSRKTAADQKLQVDTVTSDVRVVREKLDDTNVRLSTLSQEIEALRSSIPKTFAPYPAPVDPSVVPTDGGAVPAAPMPTAPAAPSTAGLSPQRMFEEAKGDYSVGQWALALAGFETLIKTFPRSDLAPEAQYYVGETHMLEGKYDKGLAAYVSLINTYPASGQVPSAYYKAGLAYFRLGQADKATESWEICVKSYPDSDASKLARQSLESAKRQPRP